MRRTETTPLSENFTPAAAFSGFVVGCASPALLVASIWIVEAHMAVPLPYVRGLSFAIVYYLVMALVLGLVWAVLFALALSFVRRFMRSSVPPWPTLAYVTLAALAAQAVTIFAADAVTTSQHLQPPQTGLELAVYVVPTLTAAILVLAHRSRREAPKSRPMSS